MVALLVVIGFRGLLDLVLRRLIPWPTLFGTDDARLREDDVVARRRAWFWQRRVQLATWILAIVTVVWLFQVLKNGEGSWTGTFGTIFSGLGRILSTPAFWMQVVVVFFLFFANFLILFGPLVFLGIQQIKGYERATRTGGSSSRTSAARPRPRRRSRASLHALAVRRGVREGGRQARARRALPGTARDRQDDALQGHRDQLQLPVRLHPGFGLRRRRSSAWTR